MFATAGQLFQIYVDDVQAMYVCGGVFEAVFVLPPVTCLPNEYCIGSDTVNLTRVIVFNAVMMMLMIAWSG